MAVSAPLPDGPAPPSRAAERRRTGLLFLAALAFYALWLPARVPPGDPMYLYRTARNLLTDGTLALAPTEEYYPGEYENIVRAPNGRFYAKWGLAQPLLQLPFVAADLLLQPFAEDLPDKRALWGFLLQLYPAVLGAAVVAAVYLLLRALDRSPREALFLSAVLGLATPLFPYATSLMSETTLAALLTGSLAAAAWARRTGGGGALLLLGLLLGLLLNLKVPAALFWPPLLLYVAAGLAPPLRRRLAWTLPGLAAGILLFLWHNHLRYGTPFRLGFRSGRDAFGFEVPLLDGLWGFLFSPNRSLFVFAPVLLLAVPGFAAFHRRHRAESRLVLALVLPWTLLHAAWHDFTGGWCWGPRFLLPVVPPLFLYTVPILAAWYRHATSGLRNRAVETAEAEGHAKREEVRAEKNAAAMKGGRAAREIPPVFDPGQDAAPSRLVTGSVAVLLALSLGVQLLGVLVPPFDYIRAFAPVEQRVVPHVAGMERDYRAFHLRRGTLFWGPSVSQVAGQAWALKHALVGGDPWEDFPPARAIRPLPRHLPKDLRFRLAPWPLAERSLSPPFRWGFRLLAVLLLATLLAATRALLRGR